MLKQWRNPDYLRLNATRRYRELSASEKDDLDDLVAMAVELCNMPVALITLIEETKQYIKASVGTDITETRRDEAFCHYTIQSDEIFMVCDTLKDERFMHHPLVTGEPHIRFYAGAPLKTFDGHNIGSLCVLHQQPGTLTERQQKGLLILARQVMHRMELSVSMNTLQAAAAQAETSAGELEKMNMVHRAFLSTFDHYFLLLDTRLNLVAFSKAWEQFVVKAFGRPPQPGEPGVNYISEGLKDDFIPTCQLVLQGGESITLKRWAFGAHIDPFWVDVTFSPFLDAHGNIAGLSVMAVLTERMRQQESRIEQQERLLREIAHTQSHKIRRPVSSILGLVHLMEMEQGTRAQEYVEPLKQVTEELDFLVTQIVHSVDALRKDKLPGAPGNSNV